MLALLEPYGIWVAALLGLVVGSFLNVVILRLPRAMEASEREYCNALVANVEPEPGPRFGLLQSLITPRSHCGSCATPLRVRDNVPVLSYLWLRGKCAHCGARFSVRYPLVEALTAGASALVIGFVGCNSAGAAAVLFTWILIALTFIDADTHYLPDNLTLPLLWLGLLVNMWQLFVPLSQAVAGAMIGYLSLWSVYWLFRLATGREGMGFGDFKLLAALGAWLGAKMLLPIILLSCISGAVVGCLLIALRRHTRSAPMPFGPYLAMAGFVALLYGQDLVRLLGWA